MTNQVNNQILRPSTDVIQVPLTLKMTTAQVIEASVNNSPIQDYGDHQDVHTPPTYEMTAGSNLSRFKIK